MLLKLILLFTVIPVVELALLLEVNKHIGFNYTILIVIVTGVVGSYLARSQGRGILNNIKFAMSQGEMPGDELINGLCVIVGGAFLITPGLITDFAGFILVIPHTRMLLKLYIRNKMKDMINRGSFVVRYKD
ncbi:MAG: FxsA protein [Alkaliphilus sp.]|nr:MAG: FxsA protein [Alkaliphilus sp.]